MDRRTLLAGFSGTGVLSAAVAQAAAPKSRILPPKEAKTGMRHRTYTGRVGYLDPKGKGEIGREWFTVTVQPSGERTLRALCEMDDFRLMRDVTLTIDADWQPIDAYVRITQEEKLVGSTWFNFGEKTADSHGITVKEGNVTQHYDLPSRVTSFGTHPLHNDSWKLSSIRLAKKGMKAGPSFSTSNLSNGGSGPLLLPSQEGRMVLVYVGPQRLKTDAGTFETEHFRMDLPSMNETMKCWAMGEDCVPVRQVHEWPDGREKRFELTDLEGDYR